MKYRCGVCGYIYDEEKEGVRFADLPDDWQCPVCGEGKDGFEPMEEDEPTAAPAPAPSPAPAPEISAWEQEELRELTAGQLSALCSNLKRGCGVQQLPREAELFGQIADYFESVTVQEDHEGVRTLLYFESVTVQEDHEGVRTLLDMINSDLMEYGDAKATCALMSDRGALRVLTWSEKATLIMRTVLERYLKDPSFLEHTGVYVCDICGFIYIGDDPPEVCPVCKVPGHMILRIQGGA